MLYQLSYLARPGNDRGPLRGDATRIRRYHRIVATGGHILVVDDERSIRRLLRMYLDEAGYTVTEAADGAEALAKMRSGGIDLVLLDLMIPEVDGLEVARRIRADQPAVPIIMLTAREDEASRVTGLEMGADDYVTKPFSPRELVSRVKANLRRARVVPVQEDPIRIGDIEVDPAARTVTRDGQEVPLTFSEFEILLKLMKSPRRVFTREELMDHLWNGSFYGDLRSVDVHVRHLRQKVERDPANPVLIRTVRGVGYALGREDGTPE